MPADHGLPRAKEKQQARDPLGPRTTHRNDARQFRDAKYYRVPLIGFNTAKRDPSEPISLIDIADLIGLANAASQSPADPVVEYTNCSPLEWTRFMQESQWQADGTTRMVPEILRSVSKRLRGYRPYGVHPGYFQVPPNESARAR